ncbi:hypothetical protein ACLB2K_068504 [Fragaria x ananassa]
MSGGPGLESLVDQTISVITNDGRNIVGVLKGFDQATNIILDESHERVFSTKEGVQQLVLGLYIIRGDNISIVGELDADLDSSLDWSKMRARVSNLLDCHSTYALDNEQIPLNAVVFFIGPPRIQLPPPRLQICAGDNSV